MTITVEIPHDVEKQIQESIVRGDIKAVRRLLQETVFLGHDRLRLCEPPEAAVDRPHRHRQQRPGRLVPRGRQWPHANLQRGDVMDQGRLCAGT